MLARSKDHCALTLCATFIVWKQGTILQKKENADGILRFEKQQKEIEAVMQQSQKYRESLESEKAALVRKYERLAAESKSSEVQMQKDVKDMKQKLEESIRVAEQFHQQIVDQKTTSEDIQRGLESRVLLLAGQICCLQQDTSGMCIHFLLRPVVPIIFSRCRLARDHLRRV
jgi:hypothetical protein